MRLKAIIITSILGVFLISGSKVFASPVQIVSGSITDSGVWTPDSDICSLGGEYPAGNSNAVTLGSAPPPFTNSYSGIGTGMYSNFCTLNINTNANSWDGISSATYYLIAGVAGSAIEDRPYYVVFHHTGSSGTGWTMDSGTPPNTTSRIISVTPPDTASSTSAYPLPYTFSLDTYLSTDDFLAGSTTISYSLVNRDQGNVLVGNFIATTSGNSTYSGSVNIGIPNGFYQGVWNMQLPFSCGNGLDGGCYSPLLATSTSFVLGYSAIQTINQDYVNATTTEKDCSQFTSATDPNYYLCPLITGINASIRWLFMPDTASIESVFGLFDILKAKAPLGYFFLLKDSISGISSTSTPIVTYTAPTEIKEYIFTPIRTAFVWIFWFFFAFNFYKILKVTKII